MDTAVNPADTDAACQGNWNTDPNCKANNGARCLLDSDCTGGGTCQDPVNAASTYSISIAQAGGELCNPMCNNVASFTATVDFDQSTDATSEFSIQRGCYDERFAAGMRRLGASGSGAGQQNVHLDWKVLIPDGEVATKPLVLGDGSVVVASVKGSLTRISPAGEKYWSIYVGMVMGNPALGSDGTIYFGSGDRNVWAVTSNGITRWRFTTPMPVHASPLVTDTGVYIGDRNGTFYRFNLDGSVAWRFYTAGELLGGSAMTRDGRVVFGSMDKSFYCLNATTGLALWRVDAGQEIVGTPLVQDVSIVFGTRESDDEYGRVIALKMDGSERWTYTASGSIESLPAEGANGEVYVSTTDGKVYAIQADGQLLWRYNTGGTGGVCKQATYSSHGLTVGTGAADPEAGTAVVLDSGTAAISTADSYYTGFRATFTLASGYLRVGQFHAVDRVFLKYVPEVATHDTDFTDSAGGDTAVAISFRTKDRMIPGETISVALPGMFQADDTAVELYPADLGADCVTGNTVCKPAGQAQFTGVAVASTAQSGTATTVVLSATAGENCGLDDACAGSTITFLSGTGAGQTATIVKYVHSSKTATITYVRTPADSTTTYRISAATVSKFTAATDIGSGTHQTLQLTVRSTTGTATCATVDDCTQTLIQLDDTEAAEAGSLDGYLIEFLAGTGAGQTTTCIRYYGSAGDEKCDIEKVQIPASTDTVYRVGPQLAAGEEVTVVVKYGQESGKEFLYPQYAGVATGGSATEVAMGADAGAEDDFYNGLEMEVQFDRTAATAAPAIGATVSTVYQTRITLNDGSADLDIDVGAYIKVNDEIMLVQQIDLGGGSDEFEVLRGRRGTAAATHAANDVVTVLYFAPITDYDEASQTATIDFTLPRAVAAERLLPRARRGDRIHVRRRDVRGLWNDGRAVCDRQGAVGVHGDGRDGEACGGGGRRHRPGGRLLQRRCDQDHQRAGRGPPRESYRLRCCIGRRDGGVGQPRGPVRQRDVRVRAQGHHRQRVRGHRERSIGVCAVGVLHLDRGGGVVVRGVHEDAHARAARDGRARHHQRVHDARGRGALLRHHGHAGHARAARVELGGLVRRRGRDRLGRDLAVLRQRPDCHHELQQVCVRARRGRHGQVQAHDGQAHPVAAALRDQRGQDSDHLHRLPGPLRLPPHRRRPEGPPRLLVSAPPRPALRAATARPPLAQRPARQRLTLHGPTRWYTQ